METVAIGKKNQKSPLRVFVAKNLHWNTTKHTIAIDHIYCDNWNLSRPFLSVKTDAAKIQQYIPKVIINECCVIEVIYCKCACSEKNSSIKQQLKWIIKM